MQLFTATLAISVVVLVAAIYWQRLTLAAAAKICASASFVGLAFAVSAHTHTLGRVFLVAFVLSFAGDVALLGKSPRWLSAGILLFLSAHLGFIVAFLVRGVDVQRAGIGLACVAPVSVVLARWIWGHAARDMRPKVLAYVSLITLMVAASAGTIQWLLIAAVLFYLSDICVARHRFVKEAFVNRALGLPLYYAAQWMFALASASQP
jgi:uncharacterized membrane protein YhhN